MIKHTVGICLVTAALAGCGATSGPAVEPAVISLGQLGPAPADAAPYRDFFYLGAGDALGHEIFTTYVASLRATEREERYATGASEHLVED